MLRDSKINGYWLDRIFMRIIISLLAGRGCCLVCFLKGYSSVGRTSVSKTGCRGFKSYCPCSVKRLILLGFPVKSTFFRCVDSGKIR